MKKQLAVLLVIILLLALMPAGAASAYNKADELFIGGVCLIKDGVRTKKACPKGVELDYYVKDMVTVRLLDADIAMTKAGGETGEKYALYAAGFENIDIELTGESSISASNAGGIYLDCQSAHILATDGQSASLDIYVNGSNGDGSAIYCENGLSLASLTDVSVNVENTTAVKSAKLELSPNSVLKIKGKLVESGKFVGFSCAGEANIAGRLEVEATTATQASISPKLSLTDGRIEADITGGKTGSMALELGGRVNIDMGDMPCIGLEISGEGALCVNGGTLDIKANKGIGIAANEAAIAFVSGYLNVNAGGGALLSLGRSAAISVMSAAKLPANVSVIPVTVTYGNSSASGLTLGMTTPTSASIKLGANGAITPTDNALGAAMLSYVPLRRSSSGLILYTHEDWLRDNQYDTMAPSSGLEPDVPQNPADAKIVPGN